MCKVDFRAIFDSVVRFRESIPNKNIFKKKKFLPNFRRFGVNYSACTEVAIFCDHKLDKCKSSKISQSKVSHTLSYFEEFLMNLI